MDTVAAGADAPWMVIGLGNPGPRHARNRHNVGQMVADHLAGVIGGRFTVHRGQSEVLQGRLPSTGGGVPGPRVVLVKPTSFMNVSGGPVSGVVRFFRVPLDRLLVIHDDLDLDFGQLRLKQGGGEGGHNGLRSISQSLGSRDYARLRVGIGRPPGRQDPADFVLRDFSSSERAELELLLAEAADAVAQVVEHGLERGRPEGTEHLPQR
jgi:PTH1 family peptidyl-tRNA hydrolase